MKIVVRILAVLLLLAIAAAVAVAFIPTLMP